MVNMQYISEISQQLLIKKHKPLPSDNKFTIKK